MVYFKILNNNMELCGLGFSISKDNFFTLRKDIICEKITEKQYIKLEKELCGSIKEKN